MRESRAVAPYMDGIALLLMYISVIIMFGIVMYANFTRTAADSYHKSRCDRLHQRQLL